MHVIVVFMSNDAVGYNGQKMYDTRVCSDPVPWFLLTTSPLGHK